MLETIRNRTPLDDNETPSEAEFVYEPHINPIQSDKQRLDVAFGLPPIFGPVECSPKPTCSPSDCHVSRQS